MPDVAVAGPQYSLMPGDVRCCAGPAILQTVLGSCVAVCLWDARQCAGGMNHFVLPGDPRGQHSARYGDVAMEQLEAGLRELGCRDLQAKVFGGANVLRFSGGKSVGTSNITFALDRLRQHRIPIVAQRTGGALGQQIRFHVATGEVFVRYITPISEVVEQ
jgi:chemotaxis protein CheD